MASGFVETFQYMSKWGWRLRSSTGAIVAPSPRSAAFPTKQEALDDAKAFSEALVEALKPAVPEPPAPPASKFPVQIDAGKV